ncbi:hypothetical protein Cgig2_003924 [Carnegiea gigantea]|uniref:HTH myb-type domain-containing protein n=1 Tax=Carnegiea gigantea TaxID=171969 RepID=A0A9Q1QEX5_9CARY|nr:hypothetical protein Cgig2_003924 [Carnegiea gigantea]
MGDISGDFHGGVHGGAGEEDDDERVHEWEAGLPTLNDLIPLTQGLIPPELLSAFDIRPEPHRTSGDVSRATRDTISAIHGSNFIEVVAVADEEIVEEEEEEEEEAEAEESDKKKARRNESPEEADSAAAKALKRPRLVWTPQLHKRFVDVVAHLGIKNAVPKTIMQLMNVDGLTRENVASHLQKYRLYLKRMQGVSFDGPANSSDPLFANSPAPAPAPASSPENVHGHGHEHSGMPIPMPIMPMSMPLILLVYVHPYCFIHESLFLRSKDMNVLLTIETRTSQGDPNLSNLYSSLTSKGTPPPDSWYLSVGYMYFNKENKTYEMFWINETLMFDSADDASLSIKPQWL